MRALTSTALLIIWTGSALADDGLTDSFCHQDSGLFHETNTAAWAVDADVNNRINAPLAFSTLALDDADAEAMVDSALQNLIRQSRGRLRARVMPNFGQCSVTDTNRTPCVEARTDLQEDICESGGDAVAWAGCDARGTTGCNVIICQDHLQNADFESGLLDTVITHELMHAYGQGHVDSGGSSVCGNLDAAPFFCNGNSDGCDGELMCSSVPCQLSPFLMDGDGDGIRATFNAGGGYEARKVYFDREALDAYNAPTWSASTTGKTATFAPRIDCAHTSSLAVNKCAAVIATRTSTLTQISVTALNNPSGEGWSSQNVVANLAVPASMPPDITINNDGTVAYIVRVDDAGGARVTRIPLNGAITSTVLLPERPVLPPRIAFVDGRLYVLMAVPQSLGSQQFGAPMFRLFRVNEAVSTAVSVNFAPAVGGVDIDETGFGAWSRTHAPFAEFDFDCWDGADKDCAIVAMLRSDEANVSVARPRSIVFQINSADLNNVALEYLNWDFGPHDANAVIGVALSRVQLFVSYSSRMMLDQNNTRGVRITGERLSATTEDTLLYDADAQACSSGVSPNGGNGVFPATTHGGHDIAYCSSCDSDGTSSLETISWGRRADDDSFCY